MTNERLIELAGHEEGCDCAVGPSGPGYVIGPVSDCAHFDMMVSLGRLVTLLESQNMSPCLAIKAANEIMGPAFTAWGDLVNKLHEYDNTL